MWRGESVENAAFCNQYLLLFMAMTHVIASVNECSAFYESEVLVLKFNIESQIQTQY